MADKKISALTASTTPLAGTEVLPIVQGGSTVKVSIANVTAGRAVAASSLTTTGNINTTGGILKVDASGLSSGLQVDGYAPGAAFNGFITNNDASAGTASRLSLGRSTASVFGFIQTNNNTEAVEVGTNSVVRLTASKTGDITANTGNLVIGTAGKGITTGSAIPLGFGVNGSVAAMTIDTSSNVGIGTTAPDIFGRFYTRSVGINSAGTTVLQINGTTYGAVDLGFNGVRTATMLAETGGFYIQTTNASNMYLLTNGLERMRIESGGNVGIGAAPAATALLDVQSTTKGVRFPNMTTGQKTAITPSAGTVIFDTDLAKLCVYSGAAWQTITSV
jgi:hypothetical protein